jgi:hypothetical protein
MDDLDIVIITSSFENINLLNERIYHEIKRLGYHNLITETKNGIQQSLTIFRQIKNEAFLDTLLSGYEYLNDSTIYIGKVVKVEKYIAKEFTGSPIRIKFFVDNGKTYDTPLEAEEDLGIIIN